MFEDATFESTGRIHTRNRRWMIAVFFFNSSLLLGLIMIPLIWPEALPRLLTPVVLAAPAPVEHVPQKPQPSQPAQRPTLEMQGGHLFAPPRIPTGIRIYPAPEPAIDTNIASWETSSLTPAGMPFSKPAVTVVHPANNTPVHVASTAEEGLLLQKTLPVYPAIAKAAGIAGTVRLAATISKSGTIENLRVTDGPMALRDAAIRAVASWRYRPYILDGQPVEVETTVDVIFTLNR
jgi:protein TonB